MTRKTTVSRCLVSIAVAAEHAAVSEKFVRRRISSGELTGYRIGKRIIRVDLNEFDALLRPIPTGGAA